MIVGKEYRSARLIGLSAAGMLALAATPAVAGTTATLIQQSSYFENYGGNGPPSRSGSGIQPNTDPNDISFSHAEGLYSGTNLTGLSQFESNSILFKNGVVVAGRASNATMTTGVAITFTNTNKQTVVRPVVTSTILAAGLGVFVTDDLQSTPMSLTACSTAALLNCTASNADTFRGTYYWKNSWASFDFKVTVGAQTIYDMKGQVGTDSNGVLYQDVAEASVLNGFRRITPGDPSNPLVLGPTASKFAIGYAWDDTNVKIALPNALLPGQSVTAIYTVTSAVRIGDGNYGVSIGNGLSTSQIAYASFGDPTGGDDPISPDACAVGAQCLNPSSVGRLNFPGATPIVDPITGEVTSLAVATTQVVNSDGETELIADLTGGIGAPLTSPPGGGGGVDVVPEPASWAMLIAGFGLTGAAMRRRRTLQAS